MRAVPLVLYANMAVEINFQFQQIFKYREINAKIRAAVVSTTASRQREDAGFEPAGLLGPFFMSSCLNGFP